MCPRHILRAAGAPVFLKWKWKTGLNWPMKCQKEKNLNANVLQIFAFSFRIVSHNVKGKPKWSRKSSHNMSRIPFTMWRTNLNEDPYWMVPCECHSYSFLGLFYIPIKLCKRSFGSQKTRTNLVPSKIIAIRWVHLNSKIKFECHWTLELGWIWHLQWKTLWSLTSSNSWLLLWASEK